MRLCGELRGRGGLFDLLERATSEYLFEVLVRRAVFTSRQRIALAGRALPRMRLALTRPPVEPDALGQASQELLGQVEVCLDDLPDPELVLHLKMHPDLVEERTGGPGEVAAVIRKALDGALACVQHPLLVPATERISLVLDDDRCQLAVDRAAEAVHLLGTPFGFLSLTPMLPCTHRAGGEGEYSRCA